MTTLWQEFRYAVRFLGRARVLVTTSVLSLALGIAATTAVFSFVNALQFKALPFISEASLVDIEETSATELCAGCAVGTSSPTLQEWQARSTSFVAMGAYLEGRTILSGAGEAERVSSARVTSPLFPMLGVHPAIGRGFTSDDEAPGAEPVVIVSDRVWRTRFGADPAVLGRTLRLDGVAHTVVGVMPSGFRFPEVALVWTPLAQGVAAQKRSDRDLAVIARLRPEVTMRQADAEMKTLAAAIAAAHPETNARWSARVRSLREALTGETTLASLVLLGAVLFVLLIACANVSNLLLVRASEREREIAIRLAIGSSRARIVRLVFTESLVLAFAGGLLGLVLALWASRAIVAAFEVEAPYWIRFGVDWHVFAFAALLTIATPIVFGVVPALYVARQDPQPLLKEGGAATTGRRGRRAAGALVIAQLALALLLLAGAGLLIKTIVRSMRFDPGFDPVRVLEADVSLPAGRYATPASVNVFVASLLERLSAAPGTRTAVQGWIFFGGFGAQSRRVTVEGMPAVPEGASPRFYFAITPGYFRMLGTRMLQGREFTAADRDDVVIINEELAQRLWFGAPVLGRRLRFADKPWRRVIGVAPNIAGGTLSARPNPFAYVPFASEPVRDLAVMLSSDADAAAFAGRLRDAVKAVDPDQPVEDVMTMAAAFREQAAPARFVALLMSGLAAVALALASIGLYGVTAYAVRRRLREIGIRMALGGTSRDVVRLIVASAWRVIAVGLVAGTLAAWAATRVLQGILFGTSPTDPAVFASVVLALAVVATTASYLPARRAARVDPIVVLRQP